MPRSTVSQMRMLLSVLACRGEASACSGSGRGGPSAPRWRLPVIDVDRTNQPYVPFKTAI